MYIEDEYYFITQCRNLDKTRTSLINKITDVIPDFINLNDIENFIFLLAPQD